MRLALLCALFAPLALAACNPAAPPSPSMDLSVAISDGGSGNCSSSLAVTRLQEDICPPDMGGGYTICYDTDSRGI